MSNQVRMGKLRRAWMRLYEVTHCWERDESLGRSCRRLRFHRGVHRGLSDVALARIARRRSWVRYRSGAVGG